VPVDFDPGSGSYTRRVRDVTITGFRVIGFEGDGVFGFGTENLKVSEVEAIDNTAYGIASFDGIGTTFSRNAASGSHDAGIYVGDSLDANAVVSHNRAWDNALGILVRHSRKAVVSDNEAWDNCIGVFLLADGQAGGSGHTAVLNNTVSANNDVCTQFADAEFLPVLGGGGIVLAGSQHNAVLHNIVRDNRGDTTSSAPTSAARQCQTACVIVSAASACGSRNRFCDDARCAPDLALPVRSMWRRRARPSEDAALALLNMRTTGNRWCILLKEDAPTPDIKPGWNAVCRD
jgi:hypothetical protein